MKDQKAKISNPIPSNEEARLNALKEYGILDTMPEKQFDDITRLASLICGTPITLISLIDEGRQWFKSKRGMEETETLREFSFCQHAIMGMDIFEVEDSLKDERFSENPYVLDDPGIRFYAGAPITTPQGHNMGTLCVIDTKPNKLNDIQREALKILANQVVLNMELKKERELIELEREKARESSDLLKAFLDHSPSYISLRSAVDGSYLMVNKAMAENIKMPKDEIIGVQLEPLFGKEITKMVLADDRSVITSGKSTTMEYNGGEGESKKYYRRHLFPVSDSKGEIYGVGSISNEITESKKLEQEILSSNERFSSLFYNSPISMLIGDMDKREFVMANNTFLKTFGYEADEIIGKKTDEIAFITDKHYIEKIRKVLSETGKVSNCEIPLQKKSGEEFVSLTSIEIISVNGRKQTISIFQDITERKRIENKLEEAKQAAELSTQAKSTFLANMSHEIRTPLNAMLGFAGILSGTDLDSSQREYLDAIDTSGNNLLGIISDILDFSKIEAGMFSIESTPFSIQQALHSVNMMLFEKAQAKKLKFFTSVDPEMPSLVNGDPTRFTQIMINLIGNAIKFTNTGQVTVECVVQKLSDQEVAAKLIVSDTGIGIAPEKLNAIFNRFTQAQEDTTRNFGGTGLGLSIARKLVELQGGELHVKSEPDKGSTFSFVITYSISNSDEYAHSTNGNAQLPSSSKNFEGKKILVVEDNLLNQKLASTILDSEGFEVIVSSNGKLAIEMLKTETVDLILMDIQMPDMDGYQTTNELRNQYKLKTPIIAMTANALAGERERCLSFGMNDYITKPFKTQELLSKIGALLEV